MAILDAHGRPIQTNVGTYTPDNMVLFVTLIHKISKKPEFSFQIIIPMDNFKFYENSHEQFTLLIQNFVGMAYGTQVLGNTEYTREQINEWIQEAGVKFEVSLSEPLPLDFIYRDSTEIDALEEQKAQIAEQRAQHNQAEAEVAQGDATVEDGESDGSSG